LVVHVLAVQESRWTTGLEEGTIDGGDEVQQGKVEGENGSILWGMIKQVSPKSQH
jgi:hypothetical protein